MRRTPFSKVRPNSRMGIGIDGIRWQREIYHFVTQPLEAFMPLMQDAPV